MKTQTGRVAQIYCSEDDSWHAKRFYEGVVDICRGLHVAGVTVLRGLEGYGATMALHRRHLLKSQAPIVIVVVDTNEKIDDLLSALKTAMAFAVVSVSDVVITRVQKSSSQRIGVVPE